MSSPGAPLPTRRRAWAATAVASTSQFVYMFDAGVVALSLPELQSSFPGTSRTTAGWVAGAFLVAQSSLLLVGGRLGDRHGRKRFFLGGLGVFCLGALLTAAAPSIWLLLAARTVQGVGAAFLTSGALALVLPMFIATDAPKVVGIWGMVGAAAALSSPTLGAVLVGVSWRLAFACTVPLCLLAVALGSRLLVDTERQADSAPIDRISYFIGPPALGVLMLVLSRGSGWGWLSRPTVVLGAVAVALAAALVRRSVVAESPLLDLGLFRHRGFGAYSTAGVLQQMGFFSWWLTVPIVGRELWGWSVGRVGFALAISQLLSLVASPTAGWLVVRWGQAVPVVIGIAMIVGSEVWLVARTGPGSGFWTTFVPMALPFGAGCAMAGTVMSGAALAALPSRSLGAGNSYVQLTRRMGGAVGVALGLALLGEASGADLQSGARRAWTFSIVVHLAALAPIALSRLRSSKAGGALVSVHRSWP
ncbi:MAG: MFS transporter [Ilumatobacteraceae bacterium]